ncbi:MAG TPA: carbon starvation protein A [Phycisphaerales bacterium]|nr:carbon starvation protein A [Phycisphaerales bacterium]|tara:strand:+ start:1353 stop:3233 length:1881 start_codon:yes stop_codon:yes gene_type:complete
MQTLMIAVGSGVAFIIAYYTYGRWLGNKIFNLCADTTCPSNRLNDGKDYVPTLKSIVFGHHFTSIAGTGPIVGPAIAVIWGWLPALLWVVFGSIFIGAVHDFGSLVVSLRNDGKTVGEIAGRLLNARVKVLFLLVLFMALTIVLAIFGLVIAAVFKMYPQSIIPCLIQIPLAVAIGFLLYRKGLGLFVPSLITLALMYVSVIYGDRGFLHQWNLSLASLSIITWVIILLVYSYVASVLPVWLLLQPRDYINSLQLISALGLVVAGLVFAAFFGGAPVTDDGVRPTLEMVAPMVNQNPQGAPAIFPFLFITVACGAISGFHCLVSSGTSSKQLKSETDARMVGYGSMLTEGFLATIVICACAAGIGLGAMNKTGTILTGQDAWLMRYATWGGANSLGAKVSAFVDGGANFLKAMGLPANVSVALLGVLVASFAGTTLDTACRLQRYVVQELAGSFLPEHRQYQGGVSLNPLVWLTNKHGATIFAVVLGIAIAAAPPGGGAWSWAQAGKGGLILWPMFGATNQLLGGLAFLVIMFYLWRRNKPVYFLVLPLLFMLAMPAWALMTTLPDWMHADTKNWPLIIIGICTLILEAWMIVEGLILLPGVRGVLERTATEKVSKTDVSHGAVKG